MPRTYPAQWLEAAAATPTEPNWATPGPHIYRFSATRWSVVEAVIQRAWQPYPGQQVIRESTSLRKHGYWDCTYEPPMKCTLHGESSSETSTSVIYTLDLPVEEELAACVYRVRSARVHKYRAVIRKGNFPRWKGERIRCMLDAVQAAHDISPVSAFGTLKGPDDRGALLLILTRADYALANRLASGELAAWVEACTHPSTKPLRNLVNDLTGRIASQVQLELASNL